MIGAKGAGLTGRWAVVVVVSLVPTFSFWWRRRAFWQRDCGIPHRLYHAKARRRPPQTARCSAGIAPIPALLDTRLAFPFLSGLLLLLAGISGPPTTTITTTTTTTTRYDPPIEDGAVPSEKLRQIEVTANAAFDTYRELYFEGGTATSTVLNRFSRIFALKRSRARGVTCSTWCPCLLDADWCLRYDVMTNSPFQGCLRPTSGTWTPGSPASS